MATTPDAIVRLWRLHRPDEDPDTRTRFAAMHDAGALDACLEWEERVAVHQFMGGRDVQMAEVLATADLGFRPSAAMRETLLGSWRFPRSQLGTDPA